MSKIGTIRGSTIWTNTEGANVWNGPTILSDPAQNQTRKRSALEADIHPIIDLENEEQSDEIPSDAFDNDEEDTMDIDEKHEPDFCSDDEPEHEFKPKSGLVGLPPYDIPRKHGKESDSCGRFLACSWTTDPVAVCYLTAQPCPGKLVRSSEGPRCPLCDTAIRKFNPIAVDVMSLVRFHAIDTPIEEAAKAGFGVIDAYPES